MPLPIGMKAPEFTLSDQNKNQVRLSQLLTDKPIVLLFYPRDFSLGCTAQLCSFRNEYHWFEQRDIQILGVSHDPVEKHHAFAKEKRLPFPLLSDPGRKVARQYDAVYPLSLLTRRVSYVINSNGKIAFSLEALIDTNRHLSSIQDFLLSEGF